MKKDTLCLPHLEGVFRTTLLVLATMLAFIGCKPSQDTPVDSGAPKNAGQANAAPAAPASAVAKQGAASALPKEISVTREAFEARYGKPLFTRKEFEAVFQGLYGLNLNQFLGMLGTNSFGVRPGQEAALAEAVRLFGNKSDSLREAYTALIPHVFVTQVQSGSIAEFMGLKSGDEILDAYVVATGKDDAARQEFYDYTRGSDAITIFPDEPPPKMLFPLARWPLKEFHLQDVLQSEAEIKPVFNVATARGTVKIACIEMLEHVLQDYTNKLALGFPLYELRERNQAAIRKDADERERGGNDPGNRWKFKAEIFGNDQDEYPAKIREREGWFSGVSEMADSVPKTRNLGAVLETRFEKRVGLDKSSYLAAIVRMQRAICLQTTESVGYLAEQMESTNAETRRHYDPFRFAEPFEGFSWSKIHNEMVSIRPVPRGEVRFTPGRGFLGQIWNVSRLADAPDFAVYRGAGVDSLIFYDKEGVSVCLQTLWGSESGFIEQFIPRHVNLAAVLELKDHRIIYNYSQGVHTRGLLAVDFRPVQGAWSPELFGELLYMPKPSSGDGAIQFEATPVDIAGNPKGTLLLNQEYAACFTNAFAMFNREPAVATQNNGLEGGPTSKDSEERLVPGIVDWPVDEALFDHDSGGNLVLAGRNYTAQLMLREYREGYRRERAQVFGRTSLVLPFLIATTLEAQRAEAAEKEYWNRYLQMMTGRSGEKTVAELLEEANRRQILRQLFQGR